MKIPIFLQKNDSVAIISTARSIEYQHIKHATDWLTQCGLKPVLGETISLKHHQFAGTDAQRITDLQQMLSDPNIKAIWCARGGYGTSRLLDFIDFSDFLNAPKWVMGFSDITALHCHLHSLGVASLHCTMPINIAENTNEALVSLQNFLFGKKISYQWKNNFEYASTEIQTEIIGGNLSVIYSVLGSKSSISTEGKILFLEDLDEYLYHIDRMILNLKRNGLLLGLKALLVGSFTKIHDNATPFGKSVEEIICEHCSEFNFPIIFNTPAGHISDNRTLAFGKKVTLTIENKDITLQM